MVYPDRLLPNPTFSCIDFDKVIGLADLVLVRHTDTTDIWDERGTLIAKHVAFQTDRLHDYSTSLLGEFEPEDIGWKFTSGSQFLALWEPGTSVDPPVYPTDVDWVNGRGAFYLLLPACHKISFDLETPGKVERATCYVIHTPIQGNFWHCSLRWMLQDQPVKDWDPEKTSRRVLKKARDFVIKQAKGRDGVPSYKSAPQESYHQLT